MGKLRLSLGVEIPNANFEAKTDGLGNAGLADGWSATSLWTTDVGANTKWLPPQMGGVGIYGNNPETYGHVLYFKMGPTALSVSTVRYIESARSRAGHFFGAEQMVASNYWKYRLRWLWRGVSSGGSPSTGNVDLRVTVYDASETNSVSYTFQVPAADYNQGWLAKSLAFVVDTSSWTPAVGNPDHCKIRIRAVNVSNPIVIEAMFAAFTLESLGPVDVGTDGTTTLHFGGAQDSFYELSRAPDWPALSQPIRMGLGSLTRLASGASRYFDPSGGILRRKWEFNQRLLRRDDYRKLRLLWDANRGYSSNVGTAFGVPLPLVLIPNQPDDIGSYYVNFTDKDFPLSHDTDFQGALDTDQFYRGTLRFEER